MVHSGGKKVIDSVMYSLGLSRHDLRHTMASLRDHGNMSSASFLWAYRDLLAEARGGGGAEAWKQVAAVAGTGGDLAAAVQALRARVAATRRAREGADGYPNSEESP